MATPQKHTHCEAFTEQVYKTKNYGMFTYIDGNRVQISISHVNYLMQNPDENFTRNNPVKVNKKMQVIDGQHRIEACKRKGWPVYYVIGNWTEADIVKFNAGQKPWQLHDFCNYNAVVGKNDNYKRLRKLCESYDVAPTVALHAITSNYENSLSGIKRYAIKDGSFTLTEEQQLIAADKLSKALEIKGLLTKVNARPFMLAMLTIIEHPEYDHKRMKNKVERQTVRIPACPDKKSYLQVLTDVYNYYTKPEDAIYFDRK